MRPDGRDPGALRDVRFEFDAQDYPEGSVLVCFGRTRVLCAASVEEGVPGWRRGSGSGWVTAEYAMLPRATHERTTREVVRGRIGGRTQEIQRLIGRSLRSVIDLDGLGEHSILLDCDVLQADGGTRTAAITGGWLAMVLACRHLVDSGAIDVHPRIDPVAAVSVGVVDGEPRLDLCYEEDAAAAVDMNVVMSGDGTFVEVQGTAEASPFDRAALDALLGLAEGGCSELLDRQVEALRTRDGD